MKSTAAIAAILVLCGASIASEMATPATPGPLDVEQLVEKLGIIGILGGAVIYLQRRSEAAEKRSQEFAEKALVTLTTATQCIGDMSDALAALKLAITAETEETKEMRRAIQESGRIMANQR